MTCWITTDPNGRERHHDNRPTEADTRGRRLNAACWRVECTGCGQHYREDGDLVHFESVAQAVAVTRARRWTVSNEWMVCSDCARLSNEVDRPITDEPAT
ncbi:MAG: hypothetical protein M3Z25_02025 [Actinomycetota bacterium]|nr:hypothetical protein [Actinomycetota bacterium]